MFCACSPPGDGERKMMANSAQCQLELWIFEVQGLAVLSVNSKACCISTLFGLHVQKFNTLCNSDFRFLCSYCFRFEWACEWHKQMGDIEKKDA